VRADTPGAYSMSLDLTTLYLVSAMVTGMSGLLFLLDMRGRPDPALRWWGLAFLFAITPAVIYALAGQAPEFVVLNPIGNCLVVAGSSLLWVGARAFSHKRTPLVAWVGPAALVAVLPFVFEQPLVTWSGFPLLAGGVVVFNMLAALECWRPVGPRMRNHVVLAVAWAGGSVFYLFRLAAFIAFGPDDPRFALAFGSEAATICVLLLIVISSFSMVALGKEVSEAALKQAATRDGLTGVLNRSEFTRLAEREIRDAVERGEGYALLLLDLDHFKRINDTHGHAIGDEVLASVATAVSRCLGPRDLFCRYGGEEFAALLPGAGPEVAGVVAERVLRAVRGVMVWTPAGPLRPTTSIGISAANVESIDLGALMRVADIALYRAKRGGRDRAEGGGEAPEAPAKTMMNA
jgi:diguanylate cyclase (GGDEF)-like protein